jgi:hypothetical protein
VVVTAGFVLWGASDALGATVDWAEGRITGRQLLSRAGLAVGFSVVGGVGKLVGKGLERLGPKLERSATSSGWPSPGRRSPAPNRAFDQSRRLGSDGWPGRYQASHAEKQQALTAPDHPIAVTKPMCADCQGFFRRQAIHTGRPQIVTDPDGTRLFHPDGRIIPNPGPNDFRPTPPQPPGTPQSVGRDRVMVGAAAGVEVGWNLPATRTGER